MPFLVNDVHGLSGLALANAEPEEMRINTGQINNQSLMRLFFFFFLLPSQSNWRLIFTVVASLVTSPPLLLFLCQSSLTFIRPSWCWNNNEDAFDWSMNNWRRRNRRGHRWTQRRRRMVTGSWRGATAVSGSSLSLCRDAADQTRFSGLHCVCSVTGTGSDIHTGTDSYFYTSVLTVNHSMNQSVVEICFFHSRLQTHSIWENLFTPHPPQKHTHTDTHTVYWQQQ